MKKNQIALYSLSVAATIMLMGCSGSVGTDGEACSTKEPGWTKDVAPMVTREDGGEAAAVVYAVDVVTSGALFNEMGILNEKVSNTGAKSGLDTLTKLFTPDMSAKNENLAALKVKKSTKSTPSAYLEGPQECAYGGTMTATYSNSDEDSESTPLMSGNFNESLTYSFDKCVENPDVIGEFAGGLYSVFGKAFKYIGPVSATEDSPERVTLNGMIGATFAAFNGEEDVPAWMGPPSWSCYAGEGTPPVAIGTGYLRGEIISDDFSAEFTSVGEEESMLFSSSMDLYFEDRYIYDIIWNDEPTANQMPEPGFGHEGLYLLAGADGCLAVTVSGEGETFNLISMRALGLEAVMFLSSGEMMGDASSKTVPSESSEPMPAMLKLNGFIEASIEEELYLSLKADNFYRGYMGYWYGVGSENAEPRPSLGLPTHIMGYLGSDCLGGMLFVKGEYNYPYFESIDALPGNGWIAFFDQAPCDPSVNELGYIEFNTEEPMPATAPQVSTIPTADLYVGPEGEGSYMGTYYSWSGLIGENSCTTEPAP